MRARKSAVSVGIDDGEHETVAYGGPQLDALIAASTQVIALKAYDSATDIEAAPVFREPDDDDDEYEPLGDAYETVSDEYDVWSERDAGDQSEEVAFEPFQPFEPMQPFDRLQPFEAVERFEPFADMETSLQRIPFFPPAPLVLEPLPPLMTPAPNSLVAVVNDMPSAPPPPVSYGIPSLSDDEIPPFRRMKVGTRVAYAVVVVVLGMMCGGIGTTSFASGEEDAPIDLALRPEPRKSELQKTALEGVLREKASLKPPLRVVLRH